MAGLTRPKEYQIDTTVTGIDDSITALNQKQTGNNTKDIGFVFERGDLTNVGMIWNEINQLFRLIYTTDSGGEQHNNVGVTNNAPLLTGTHFVSTGKFAVDGDARAGVYLMRNETTNATPTELFLDGVSQQLIISNNSVWTYEILLSAKRTDAGFDAASFKITGAVSKDVAASTVTLVGTPSNTVTGRTDSTWRPIIGVNSSTGALTINVVGSIGKTVRWVARVVTLEVSF